MSDGFDLFERLGQTASGRRIIDMFDDMAKERDGAARQAMWDCEDGWYVTYTTTRIVGGPHDGSFIAQLFKPGRGKAKNTWSQEDRRVCATRKEAKDRAIKWYREHSPKWNAKHPERSVGDPG